MSYRVKFTFPVDDDRRERMLPSIDLYLRALESADRLIAGCLGLELDYRRALKEMGESHFDYAVTISLRWPSQILLGSWPESSALREWMERVRSDLMKIAAGGGSSGDAAGRWDRWAHESELDESLVYSPPAAGRLEPLIVDLSHASGELGGVDSVRLF